jgi:hypothetical protein
MGPRATTYVFGFQVKFCQLAQLHGSLCFPLILVNYIFWSPFELPFNTFVIIVDLLQENNGDSYAFTLYFF